MWALTGNAINYENEDRDDGGPNCYAEIDMSFRAMVTLVSVAMHVYSLKNITLPYIRRH
jgi:hypothetical protein